MIQRIGVEILLKQLFLRPNCSITPDDARQNELIIFRLISILYRYEKEKNQNN
jgi:hypothetical protein